MSTTTEQPERIVRTYERFAVHFDRGTRVSPFDTHAEALAWLGDDAGHVERTTWDVEFEVGSRLHQLARPGIAERAL